MRSTRPNLVLFLFAMLITNGEFARILGIFPHTGKSHYMAFQPLTLKLAERGHRITAISSFPLEKLVVNFTDVSIGSTNIGVESIDLNRFENRSVFMNVPVLNTFLHNLSEMNSLREAGWSVCNTVLGQKSLAKALTKEYDVVLMENFNSDCFLGLLHVFGNRAPIIGLSSCSIMPWTPDRFGLPDNPAYVPFITSSFTDNMSFRQRFENTILYVYFKFWYRQFQERERALIEEYYGVRVPDLGELAKKTQMLLVNTFPNINKVRPLLPTTVEVGGMHLDHTKKVISPVC